MVFSTVFFCLPRASTVSLAEFFTEQQERILKLVEQEYKDFQYSLWDDELMRMWEMLSEHFVGVLINAVRGGINLLPPGIRERVDTVSLRLRLVDYARLHRDQWLKYINDETRDFVMESILKWQQSGEPFGELVKILSNEELGIFNEARAKMIATTEVTRLHAWGTALAWEKSGYLSPFRWNTANDERVCPICGERENKVFPLSFLRDNMPAHPRCRCWASPIVDLDREKPLFDFTLEPGEWLQ
jgi:SPP1 gp7 family putative phage head morphogenesis protein